jgi:hypothetical protein
MEGQEALLSILLEPCGEAIDGLASCLSADESTLPRIDAAMRIADMRTLLESVYDWALTINFDKPENQARFWYVSEEKLEPRLGSRTEDEGAEREQPLCVARLASTLHKALTDWADDASLADFLLQHPEHRFMVRRAQIAARFPYTEIRDNLIAADMLPIDMMRFKLACFGASHFDPRSDRWVRISLFQGAPYPVDMNLAEHSKLAEH